MKYLVFTRVFFILILLSGNVYAVADDLITKQIVINEPTLKSKACLKCLYFTKIISALCCYLEYFSYLYTIN